MREHRGRPCGAAGRAPSSTAAATVGTRVSDSSRPASSSGCGSSDFSFCSDCSLAVVRLAVGLLLFRATQVAWECGGTLERRRDSGTTRL